MTKFLSLIPRRTRILAQPSEYKPSYKFGHTIDIKKDRLSSGPYPQRYNQSADACKNVTSFEIIMQAVYGPHSWFLTQSKETGFFISNLVFLTIKTRLQYYSQLNMSKSHFNDEYIVLLGPIITRFLHVQIKKRINQNNKGCVL